MRLSRAIAVGTSALLGNRVNAYWWDVARNAGDEVAPFLLRAMGFTPVHTWKDQAEVIVCGSVLQNLSADFAGHIIGAGILNLTAVPRLPRARIDALRGELTKEALRVSTPLALGDPGLLLPFYLPGQAKPRYKLGIIPHFREKADPRASEWGARYPREVLLIDIQRGIRQVIRQMLGCSVILSSSLHGLVFADAYGIPSAWYSLQEALSAESQYKYLDYYSVFQRQPTPIHFTGRENLAELLDQAVLPDREALNRIQADLQAVFENFAREQRASQTRRKR
jgi:pyruvyltransferase